MDNRKPLTYGYIIALSPFNQTNSFIMSDGFIKNNPCIREIQAQNGSGSLHDRCLFMLYPSFNTQYIEKALKTVEEQKQIEIQNGTQKLPSSQDQDNPDQDNQIGVLSHAEIDKEDKIFSPNNEPVDESKSQAMLTSALPKINKKKIEEKKKQFESKVVNEYKHNLELFEKQKGQPINFDKPVQLLHVASNKFLACNYIEAELEKENFKLDLQEFSSKNTHFKLQPSFSHQKRSDNVVEVSDVVFITSAKMYLGKIPYLNSSLEGKMKGVKHKSELLERNYDYIQQRDKIIQKYKDQQSLVQTQQQKEQTNQIESTGNFTLEDEGFTIDLRQPLDYKTKTAIEFTQNQLLEENNAPNIKDFIIPEKIDQGGAYLQPSLLNKNIVAKNITDIKQREQTLRKEANVSLESKTKWKIQPYSEYIEDENHLCFGQVIWLHHIESQNTVVISKQGNEGLKVNMEGSQVRDQQFQKYEGNTNGMWIIENQHFTKGGPVEWDKPVYFRNLSLGKYLAIKEERYGNQDITQFTTQDHPDQRAVFSFSMMPYAISLGQNQKIVMKDSFFYIKSHYKAHGGFIHIKEDNKMGQSMNFIEEQNEDLSQESAKIDILDQATDEDSFKLFRATMTEVLEQSFLISCFPVIKQNLDIFNRIYEINYGKDYKKLLEELDKNKVEKKMKTLKGCLEDLEKFVNNKLIITSIDQQRNYGKPNRLRQKVLYEQDYIQNLVHLLRFMTKDQELHELNKLQNEQEKYAKLKTIQNKVDKMKPFSQHIKEGVLKKIKNALFKKLGYQLNFNPSEQLLQLMTDVNQRKKNRVINYFKTKVNLIKIIYSLLQSICKDNEDNQYRVKSLFYHFQYQTKYIPEAVNFIISIVSQNEFILNNLCDDIKIIEKNNKKKAKKHQKMLLQKSMLDQKDYVQGDPLPSQLIQEQQEDEEYSDPIEASQQITLNRNISKDEALNMFYNTDLTSDQDNLIMFFMKQTEDNQEFNKNMNYLRLFRSICKFKNKGISVNQEQIFRLFKQRSIFKQSLLLNMKVIKSKLQITSPKGRIEYLEAMKVDKNDQIDPETPEGYTLNYLIEQIKFYSDLALSRNFLWKNELDQIFPILYVVGKIFSENLHTTIRSAFCNLALTQYIDHEPFNQMVLPNKCRIHFTKQQDSEPNNIYDKITENIEGVDDDNEGKKDVFQKLITNSQIYFYKELEQVDMDLEQQQAIKKALKKEKSYKPGPNILSNHLTYDIIRMLGTLLQFGIIDIQNTKIYSEFIILLVRLLEYDYQVSSISCALKEVRKVNFERNLQKQTQSKLLKGVKGIFSQMVEGIGDVVGIVIDLADYTVQKLGILNKKKEDIDQELAEYSSSYNSKNPLIGGLISLTSMLKNQHQSINNTEESKNEVKIKLEICDQLIFMQKLRIDFLISNFICWFDSKGKKYKYMDLNDENWKKKFESDIEDDLHSIIPDIFKTGIEEIDEKYTFKPKNLMKNLMNFNLFNNSEEDLLLKKMKPKKFTNFTSSQNNPNSSDQDPSNNNNNNPSDNNNNDHPLDNSKKKNKKDQQPPKSSYQYTFKDPSKKKSSMKKSQQNFIPDLDTLLAGPNNEKEIKSELLPSLITSFYLVSNSQLEDKILEVIFKCFMQTTELFQYLHEIEVLFDEKDVFPYLAFQKKIQDLRLLAEKSEVWLSEFQENMYRKPSNEDISKTIRLLEEIKMLFYQNSQVALNGEIEVSDSDKIDKTRQKIFTFLNGHQPLINLVKDAQNQMAKILKQEDISPGAKKTIYLLLRNLYRCLQIFCQGVEENQNILSNHIGYFMDEISHDFGQFDLLIAIFEDNKYLCENIQDSLIKTVLQAIKEQGRQERFLRLFKVMMQRKDKQGEYMYIVENQIKVFKWFVPSFYQDKQDMIKAEHLVYGHIDKNKKQFHFNFNLIDYEDDFMIKSHHSNSSAGALNRDQPFHYHSALIDIFLVGISGDEGLNLNGQKVKNILPLGYLLEDILCKPDSLNEHGIGFQDRRSSVMVSHDRRDLYKILREEDGYSIIKPKVLEFILSVYLNMDKPVVDSILKYSEQWIKLFEFETERIKEASSFTDKYKPYLNLLISNLIYIYVIKITSHFEDHSEIPGYEALHSFIYALVKKIDLVQHFIGMIEYENVKKLIKIIDPELYDLYKKDIEKPVKNVDHSNTSSNLQKMVSKLSQNNESNTKIQAQRSAKNLHQQQQNSQLTTGNNNKDGASGNNPTGIGLQEVEFQLIKEEQDEMEEDDYWLSQKNWKALLNLVSNSNALKQAEKNQFSALGEAIINIDKMVPEKIIKEYNFKLDHKAVLTKMISYLYNGIANKVNIQNMEYMLQVLQGILDNAEEEGKLEEMQNLLDSIDATKMFLHLVSDSKQHPFDSEFFMVLLDFMIKLLENGNPKIQQSIYDYFIIYPQSEVFFNKIYQIFSDYIEFLKEQKKKQEKGIHINNDSDQNKLSDLVIRLLSMLQLFCEGHNLQLQNYLKKQTNSRNNFDMVTIIVELLYQYHQSLTKSNFDNITKCLDTLIEFIQGPCPKNQETIIDSKFFEIAQPLLLLEGKSGIEQLETSQKDIKKRRSTNRLKSSGYAFGLSAMNSKSGQPNNQTVEIDTWQIERLKYKTMILVTSLLELNSSPQVIKRIMRSLPLEVLKQNLILIYKRYMELYNGKYLYECLKHADLEDPDEFKENQKLNKKKSQKAKNKELKKVIMKNELIVETGFFIYFLIMYYLDLDSKDIDGETSSQLDEIKELEKNQIIMGFKNNIVGQLATLVFDILELFLAGFKQAGNALNKAIGGTSLEKQQKEQQEREKLLFMEAISFFNKNSAHIEIIRNDMIEKVHFILMPFCKYLPKETKINFNSKVNRDSIHSKIEGLVAEAENIIEICKHEQQLSNFFERNKIVAIFAKYVNLWKDIAFLLSILLNCFILMGFDNEVGERTERPKIYGLTESETDQVFQVSGIIMIVCSTFVVTFFLLKNGPIYSKQAWDENKEYLGQNCGKFQKFIRYIVVLFICFLKVLLQVEVLYYLSYGAFAFIATLYHYFFFSFHLTEFVIRYPTLRNILKSAWLPKVQLMLTFLLILLFTYFLSVAAYLSFHDSYDGRCDTLYLCFFESFDRTFKSDGGLGGWLEGNKTKDSKDYDIGRFFFDNIANIIIVILLVEIFSGIIIDKFSNLRQIETKKNNDIQELCFICGHTRELFERKSDAGFESHVKNDHYLWNYIFYLAFLFDKDRNEYTGVEQYVFEKYEEKDNIFFPVQRALVLDGLEIEEDEQNIQALQQEANMVRENLKLIAEGSHSLAKKVNLKKNQKLKKQKNSLFKQ